MSAAVVTAAAVTWLTTIVALASLDVGKVGIQPLSTRATIVCAPGASPSSRYAPDMSVFASASPLSRLPFRLASSKTVQPASGISAASNTRFRLRSFQNRPLTEPVVTWSLSEMVKPSVVAGRSL